MSVHPSHDVVTTREDYGSARTHRYCVTCGEHDLTSLEKPCAAAATPAASGDQVKALERALDLAEVWATVEPAGLMSRQRAAATLREVLDH